MTMGKHRATEEGHNTWIETESIRGKPTRLRRAWVEYCQPFYKRYRKSIVAAASTAITTIFAVYTDGISQDEWMFILIQVGATLGVWRFPNATNKKVVKTND